MRSFHLLIFAFLLTASSYAQTIGTNSFIFKSANQYSLAYGYGIGIEYGYCLWESFDFIVEPAFLYSRHISQYGKLEYIQVPVHAGIRFYIFDYYLKPYISLSGIASYFSNDQLRLGFIDKKNHLAGTFTYMDSYSNFNYGINLSLGTIVAITDYWKINLNITASIISDRYADYSGYKVGLIYNLK